MTPEERFERIEKTLEETATLSRQNEQRIAVLLQSMGVTQQALTGLASAQDGTQKALTDLIASIDRYVTSANTRMEQMERNLDNLIRIITAEHSNGKGGRNE